MTYFGFLIRFLLPPIFILLVIQIWKQRKHKQMPNFRNDRAVWISIAIHIVLAVIYTTPWDNYLVANHVWFYEPKLVSGLVIGYVPIEEYTFFILESLLAGLWWWFLSKHVHEAKDFKISDATRWISSGILIFVWIIFVLIFFTGFKSMTYISIIFFWALPAIFLQFLFGADILWHYRRLLMWVILPATLYLSITDSLAISSGTWTIDPLQSTRIFIGALPLEEAVFFLVTNILLGFGMTLFLAHESPTRIVEIKKAFERWFARTPEN